MIYLETPSIFQIGRLSNIIEEINKGTGSTWTYISYGDNGNIKLSLTFPDLVNDIEQINSTVQEIHNYFGLKKNEFTASILTAYGKVEIMLSSVNQGLTISVSSR